MIEGFAALRAPFPKSAISKLDRGNGLVLDYVGHAAVTARLLEVDPLWTWEPFAVDEHGLPAIDEVGGLWIRLTVLGVTRIGYGDTAGKKGPNAVKEAIGDAIRNAAMRFGVALDLWSKDDIRVTVDEKQKASVDQIASWNEAIQAADTQKKLTVIAKEIAAHDVEAPARALLLEAYNARMGMLP
jgi:hypothetical protein